MDLLAEIRRPIEEDLLRYKAMFDEALQHDNPLLSLALQHLGKRRGKLMRPMLVLLAARYMGEVNDSVLHAAVALELLHTASLVHDDVVDKSERRRGQQSVNALIDNQAAVLVGDYLLSQALHHAALTGSVDVVEAVAKLGQTLADGELLQLANLDNTTFLEQDYYAVIERKTASLFETCAACGHLLSRASEQTESLRVFGRYVGLCFQIRDDIFDYESDDVGKPIGIDIREGKITLPLIHCLECDGAEQERVLALKARRGEITDDEIASLLSYAHVQGGIDYAKQQMHCLKQQALQSVMGQGSEPIQHALQAYADYVAGRDL